MTVDPLLLDTAERAFADTCTHGAIQAAERDGWAPAIWETAAGIGLPWKKPCDSTNPASMQAAHSSAVSTHWASGTIPNSLTIVTRLFMSRLRDASALSRF